MKVNAKSIFKRATSDYSFVLSFLALVIIAFIFNRNFFSYSNLSTLMLQSAIKGIIAVGMTLVIISGQIDLSAGSACALTAGLGVVVLNNTGNTWIMLLFCVLFGVLLGLTNGIITTKGKMAPFVATLATQVAYRSIIVQIGQGGPFNVADHLLGSFSSIAGGSILGIPNLAIFFVIVAVAIALVMSLFKFGRYVYAVGSNETAARLTGIGVDRIKLMVFGVMGLLTGVAAFLLSSRLTSITAANAASGFELDAIAAVAIGGTSMNGGRGRILGTFLGAIMLQMIEGILIAAHIPVFLNGLVKGVIIILAVLFQSGRSKEA